MLGASPVALACEELPDEDLAAGLAGELAQAVGKAALELALVPGSARWGGVGSSLRAGANPGDEPQLRCFKPRCFKCGPILDVS